MTELKQIIYALERAERTLQAQADALCDAGDYSAEFPDEDAQCMREAKALLQAGQPAQPAAPFGCVPVDAKGRIWWSFAAEPDVQCPPGCALMNLYRAPMPQPAPTQPVAPPGYFLVPEALAEPTEEMLAAFQRGFIDQLHRRKNGKGEKARESAERAGLRAMLAVAKDAAPQPAAAQPQAESAPAAQPVQPEQSAKGLTVQTDADGVWLNFAASTGLCALLNVERIADSFGGITSKALRDWTADISVVGRKSLSAKMRAAGYTPRDRRLTCDECGAKFTAQMAPLHECIVAQPGEKS